MGDLLSEITRLMRRVTDLESLVHRSDRYVWATVMSVNPVVLRIDGSSTDLQGPFPSLVGELSAGQRVEVRRSGTQLTITGSPVANAVFFPGFIMEYAGATAPPGWLLCDGRQVRVSDYPQLYAVIGTRYGGSGSVFSLPDHRGRVGVGLNPANPAFNHLGRIGGSQTHTLTVAEMPSHTHPLTKKPAGPAKWDSTPAQVGGTDYSQTFWTGSHVGATGGNQPHNNLQPYLTVNFIIKT